MANNIAFQPMGNCVVATAASSNTQGNVVTISSNSPSNQYLMFNPNKDNPVFVAIGETASITATIPGANGAPVIAVAPYTERIFTGPQSSSTKTIYARIISPHNNAELFIMPGEGL